MKLGFLSFFLALSAATMGQGFLIPVEDFPASRDCRVTLADGRELSGKIKSVDAGNGLTAIKMVDSLGQSIKLTAPEIRTLRIKANGLVRMELMAESTETIKKFTKADWKDIREREYIVFEKVTMPGKKGKSALLQLLNPDFDSRMKVYQDPWAQETQGIAVGVVQVTGGEDRSYLYVKNSGQAFKVKRGSYKKDFLDIYGDCPEMVKAYAGEKLKFKAAAEHVWVYDHACQGAAEHNP